MMDQQEYKGSWLNTIIIFCLILALVVFVYKEMPELLSSLMSKVEEIRLDLLLNKLW